MKNQRTFNLSRTHPVTRYVQNIIDPARDAEVAVRIAKRAVAGKIVALISREVSINEALVITVDGSNLARP